MTLTSNSKTETPNDADSADSAAHMYNPKSEKVGTVWKTQIKKESSDF